MFSTPIRSVALFAVLAIVSPAFAGPPVVDVRWTGGAGTNEWMNPQNWSPAVVPINSPTTHYAVTIPASGNVVFAGVGGGIEINSLTTGLGSNLDLRRPVRVTGEAFISGAVEVIGSGAAGAFTVDGAGSRLIPTGSLRTGGNNSLISFGASSYSSAAHAGFTWILIADAIGSRVVCPNLTLLDAGFNDGNPAARQVHAIDVNDRATLDLPSLQTLRGAVHTSDRLKIRVDLQGQLLLPALRTVDSGYTEWQFLAPVTLGQATAVHGAAFSLVGAGSLNAPLLANFNTSTISASDGGRFTSVATSYASYTDRPEARPASSELFNAVGAGSVLNLASIVSIDTNVPGGNGLSQTIRAYQGGRVDLSGLRTITGSSTNQGGLAISFVPDGTMDLNRVEHVTGNVTFELSDNLDHFNHLQTATDVRFNVIQQGATLRTPALSNMDRASVTLARDASYTSVATSYSSRQAFREIAFRSGFQSTMNLDSFMSIDAGFDDGVSTITTHLFETSGGVMTLRHLSSIIGPARAEDSLTFRAANGTMTLGSLSAPANTRFELETGGNMDFLGGLHLLEGSLLRGSTTPSSSRLSFGENFTSANTLAARVRTDQFTVVFRGAEQLLEIAGRDLGNVALSPSNPNFSIGVLQIGDIGVTTTVRLVDLFDNSTGVQPEALYLSSFNSVPTSLRILNESTLILSNLPVYARINGSMVALSSLFTPGVDRVRFDQGWIVIPTPATGFAMTGFIGFSLLRRRRRACIY